MTLDLLSVCLGFALGLMVALGVWLHQRTLKSTLSDHMKALSMEALSANSTTLIDLARGQLDQREQSFRELISPIQQRLQELDRSQHALSKHLTGLEGETGRLVQALRTPHVRGRWGEVQLARVVELAGMTERCDFSTQVVTDSLRRPDLVVHLPGGKQIAVDAKTPLDAYLTAMEAEDEPARKAAMLHHARQVREHVRQLSAKSYWEQFEVSPEFVVLFLPGENFFAAALEADPSLIETAANERVVLATPTTLIALLRAVHYGWRQEKLAETAKEIAALGKDLYDRTDVLISHFGGLGKALDKTVEAYNKTLASFETRVMVTARKLSETGVVPAQNEIKQLDPIEKKPRLIAPDDASAS